MLAPNVVEVARRIGLFYLQKNSQDYAKTEKELTDLRISKIEVDVKNVTVYVSHVGLFIGRRGENIDKLSKFLKLEVKIVEDRDSIYDALIPRKLEDYL